MYLTGVYAPREDEKTEECKVEGSIPTALNGEFARNGPNPRFPPKGGYHWFDGDGMVSDEKCSLRPYSTKYTTASRDS